MTTTDYILTSLNNIRKNKLRSILTIIGVAVAIGALTSMLSFGIGLQKNINKSIEENNFITTIKVTTPQNSENQIELNDSVIQVIESIKGVKKAFFENRIPSKILLFKKEYPTTIKTIPFTFRQYFDKDSYKKGSFFDSDSSNLILLTEKFIYDVIEKDTNLNSEKSDSIMEALIGSEITVSALTLDISIMTNIFSTMSSVMNNKLPLKDSLINFKISGIVKGKDRADRGTGAYITQNVGGKIPKLDFNNIWDLLNDNDISELSLLQVFTSGITETELVQKEIREMGLNASSILDEMEEIKKVFLIMDSILGAIGIMALFISTLGLVNTLIMSIYERTREIGILKSLGAKDSQIGKLFLIEAGCIGLIGSIFGIPLGWIVTKIAESVLFSSLFEEAGEDIELFSFPWYLICGAIIFSIVFSILAGLYPSQRASRTDPVKALRHE